MRLLTYNVRSLRSGRAAVAEVVRFCRPDVVCVQEAPRFLRWRSKRAALARLSGLVVAEPVLRVGGVMVMTSLRAQVVGGSAGRLSATPRLHHRAVVASRLAVDGVEWTVASVHLGLDAAERRRHVDEVLAALPTAGSRLVVAGDLNEEADSPAWRALTARLADACPNGALTYPSRDPQVRIDSIFTGADVEVVSCEVVRRPAVARTSDHLPVLADLRPHATGAASGRSLGGGRC